MENRLPFSPLPKARANLHAGAVYAIDGGDSYVYYGQVAADKSIGFFKYRSEKLSSVEVATASELMCRLDVAFRSIGEALRAGVWLYLGSCPLRMELSETPLRVQWPVGTLQVTVWKGRCAIMSTLVHDPAIQNLEVSAAHDAIYHVPKRLSADFSGGFNTWPVGGTIWRKRVMKEEIAKRCPEQSWHALPSDWVYVDRTI